MATEASAADRLFDEAIALHRRGELARAGTLYAQILALAPRHVPALHLSGVLELQRGNAILALQRIRLASQLAPHESAILSNLASTLIALNRHEEAIVAASGAVRLDPASADAYGNLATAYHRKHRYAEAAVTYRQALELAPGRPGLHSGLGLVLGLLGDYEGALASHRKALSLAPASAGYRNNFAVTLTAMGLAEDAEEALQQAVDSDPDDPDLKFALARLKRKQAAAIADTSQPPADGRRDLPQ